jgi:hypothetical protein
MSGDELLLVQGPMEFEDLAQGGVVDEVALVVEDGRAFRVPAGKQAPGQLGPFLTPGAVVGCVRDPILLELAASVEQSIPAVGNLKAGL